MAVKEPNLTNALGSEALQKYLDAQKYANEVLEERNNRLFDPTMLAMAQGFLAPTKTGGFGESIGNVAAAVGPAQAAEEKRTMDMAKMRLEMAQQGLQTSMQTTKAQQNAELMKKIANGEPLFTPPAAQAPQAQPVPTPVPAPQAGALASAAPQMPPMPQGVPAMPQAAPQAPLAQAAQQAAPQPEPQGPAGSQLFPAMPQNLNREEKLLVASMANANKEPYEILKELDEMRRKNIVVNERGATNIKTGQVFAPVDPTPTEVRIPGKGTYVTNKTMASRLAGAQAENDPEKFWSIADQITQGIQRPPAKTTPAPANATPTGAAPASAPTQAGMKTKAQEEADAALAKAEAEKAGTGRGARTSTAMDKVEPAIEVRAVAQAAKDLVNQEGADKVVGIFEKPTVRAALAKMVDEGKFTPVGFRDAMVAANVAFSVPQKPDESSKEYTQRKQDILDRYYQLGTQVARARFEASTLAKGQGAFSDGERRMFADTTINTKMSVNSINKTADMLLARANFAEKLANAIEDSTLSYDRFRRTPEYQKMLKEYEGELRSIWGGKQASSSSGKPDLDAAREEAKKALR